MKSLNHQQSQLKNTKDSPKTGIFDQISIGKTPLGLIAYAAISYLIGKIAPDNLLPLFILIGFALLWWWDDWHKKQKLMLIKKQEQEEKEALQKELDELLFSANIKAPESSLGLILLLSPYSPQKKELKDESFLSQFLKKIIETDSTDLILSDFENIDLWHSNLFPQIKAIEHHNQENILKFVWLITTEKNEIDPGSEATAKILEKYLKFQYREQLSVFKENLTIPNNGYYQLYKKVEEIFNGQHSGNYKQGFKNEQIIADITGGNKMMSIALALACIPPKRRLQYMDNKRDWQGQPLEKGKIKPILIDIDPIIYSDS